MPHEHSKEIRLGLGYVIELLPEIFMIIEHEQHKRDIVCQGEKKA